ncbi:hypothetical protein HRI_003419100 [Hibiscus trionum]|uniref:Reverse transcriptase domain-containing protein n=1 Tax=Hibiscus trionum TaxID=183268 RepID=A0A9W7ILK7_HIBTR|nr:hypothetical protein HRI_003419100 [Hibiscus trionum]
MGFASEWVSLVLRCIKMVSYSVVINGSVGDSFVPSRGLRQGDPLSPFLFLICSEGLSSLLRHSSSIDNIIGIRITRGAPLISHLFFADDTFIFCEASTRGAIKITDILQIYARCLEQVINMEKSSIFFSSNVLEDTASDVRRILGVRHNIKPEKYLGLPLIVGRNRRKAFMALRDRFIKSLSIRCVRVLSQGGKEVFIKSILQAIPIYSMSCFLLSKSFCHELEQIIARFWWHHSQDRRGIHWCSWPDLCITKDSRGLGFRDFAKFNVALLAKQGWRLIQNPSSLVARLLRARYYPDSTFLKARLGASPSLT